MSYQLPAAAPPLEYPHYGIGFVDAIKRALKKYAVFTGRASRGEYWWWTLANFIVGMVLAIPQIGLGLATSPDGGQTLGPGGTVFGVLSTVVSLAVLVPSLAVAIRRLHDAGYSGWYYLLVLIPLVGGIILIVFLAKPASPQGAKYDPAPTGGYGYAPQAGQTYDQPGGYPTYDGGYGQNPGAQYPSSQGYSEPPSYPPAQGDPQNPYSTNPYPTNPYPTNPYSDPQNPSSPQSPQ